MIGQRRSSPPDDCHPMIEWCNNLSGTSLQYSLSEEREMSPRAILPRLPKTIAVSRQVSIQLSVSRHRIRAESPVYLAFEPAFGSPASKMVLSLFDLDSEIRTLNTNDFTHLIKTGAKSVPDSILQSLFRWHTGTIGQSLKIL
jgi:hypothetical protein